MIIRSGGLNAVAAAEWGGADIVVMPRNSRSFRNPDIHSLIEWTFPSFALLLHLTCRSDSGHPKRDCERIDGGLLGTPRIAAVSDAICCPVHIWLALPWPWKIPRPKSSVLREAKGADLQSRIHHRLVYRGSPSFIDIPDLLPHSPSLLSSLPVALNYGRRSRHFWRTVPWRDRGYSVSPLLRIHSSLAYRTGAGFQELLPLKHFHTLRAIQTIILVFESWSVITLIPFVFSQLNAL